MALVKCKECGGQISKKSKSCPHCGYEKPKTGCFTQLVAVVFVLFVIGIFVPKDEQKSPESSTQTQISDKPVTVVSTPKVEVEKPSAKPEAKPNLGAWKIHKEKSKLDDSQNVFIWVESPDNNKFGTNYKNKPAILHIKCAENKTALYVTYNGFISTHDVPVITRIDNNKAQTTEWSVTTDHQGIWRNQPIPFIKSLIGKDKLLVEVTPYSENPQMREFPITGLDEAIKPVREICRW